MSPFLKYRLHILIFLVIVLFTNWYFYQDSFLYLRDQAMSSALGQYLLEFYGLLSAKRLLVGPLFFALIAINCGISLLLLHVYFFYNAKITKTAASILGVYNLVLIIALVAFNFLDNKYLYTSARFAIDMMASPIVEAIMIPLMKLYTINSPKKEG